MASVPDPVDVIVGSNIRALRTRLGISQTTLGEALGISFQQVQKYERGSNRVSASKLVHMGNVLNVNVERFFEGTGGGDRPAFNLDLSPQALEVARWFDRLRSPSVKTAIKSLLSTLDTHQEDHGDKV